MNIRVGLAQIPNSVDLDKNFRSIMDLLGRFEAAKADLVLFPECGLSGFTAKMKDCTLARLEPYLGKIQAWAARTGIEVVLPTAMVVDGRVYNTGRWFSAAGNSAFYKIGLTEPEKRFFSPPEIPGRKVFETRGFRFGLLICFEAQQEPWTYFRCDEVDAVLWPGYWGWTPEDGWGPENESGKPNLIYANLEHWRVPLLQSNFAGNDLEGHADTGPEGLSLVVGEDNSPRARGLHKESGGLVVELEKQAGATRVSKCHPLPAQFSFTTGREPHRPDAPASPKST